MSHSKYSADDDRVLVEALIREAHKGRQSENGFKAAAFVAAAQALEGSEEVSGGKPKTANSCRDHFGALKKEYFIVKALRELSGFGWDEERSLVTAPDDVWDKYIEAHPNAKKWRKFPLFDEMGALVDGTAATGEGAYHPGQPADVPPTQGSADKNWAISPVSTPRSSPSPSPPAAGSGTRKRAASPSLGSQQRSRKQNGKLTAADTVGELVRVVGSIQEALVEPPDTPSILCPSPKRRKDAIRALVLDTGVGLTPRRKVKLITRFRQETSIADTYSALSGDDVLRAGFLQEELESLSFQSF
ncbi:hypothetical protein K466DRAFT_607113 [Polyporus arcularius HHB13444]|uniref:Myb/SANT-like domain-containing protein n=1 Tax=Polyporus arcularius HHB13444 TaxID=1314778 RepID=A0A5C3NPP0_9APHY|nr:hypothetical protein K466DRAFT_607113 [Polyporus arcularius HHB13444]